MHNPSRLPRETTSEPPMVVLNPCGAFHILTSKCASRHNGVHFFDISTSKSGPNNGVLYILTSKCASRHNGVHFFDISTSKSGPNLVFVHFDFEMCFAPQRRALFRHLNFQKWSEPGVLCNILTSKCASRHNGVQFFISHLARWLRTRRFSEPTFRPLRSHKSLEKHSVSRLSYLFAHLHLLSSDSFSSLIFSLLIFSLLLFSSL